MLRRYGVLLQRVRCAVYGGAFDPPTTGHMKCVELLLTEGIVDEVLVVPCGSRPDKLKLGDKLSRYVMTEIAVNTHFENNMNVQLCDWEYHSPEGIATYDLLERLATAHPDREYSFVVGTDWLTNAAGIPTWESEEGVTGKLLLSKYDFLVIPRPGYDVACQTLDTYGPRFRWVVPADATSGAVDISSTEIRQFVGDGDVDAARPYLPAPVLSYIRRNGLYQGNGTPRTGAKDA